MNVIITYKEISDFIEHKFKIRPTFSSVNKNILNVSYKPMAKVVLWQNLPGKFNYK